jgi:hypothetical protein
MPAFETPVPILQGFKDNLSALTAQGMAVAELAKSIRSGLTCTQEIACMLEHQEEASMFTSWEASVCSWTIIFISMKSFDSTDGSQSTPVQVKQGVTRRAIDQLGFVKDANSLVILSIAGIIVIVHQ